MSQTTLAAQPDAAARPGLSTAALKMLGAALMLPDHIHEMFAAAGAPLWLTIPGRLVFPLFLFASAEAFAHTRSRRAYALRLLLASWGMTLLTTLLQAVLPNRDIVLMNNAFSTLFLAVLYMQVWDWLAAGVRRRRPALLARGLGLALAGLAGVIPLVVAAGFSFNPAVPSGVIRVLAFVSLLLPNPLSVEGGFVMTALGVAFYALRRHRAAQIAVLLGLSAVVTALGNPTQGWMALAALPIAAYSGAGGRACKGFFYLYYPAHIVALYLLACAL